MFIKDKNNEYTVIGASPENTTNRLDKGMYNIIVRPGDGPFSPPKVSFVKNDDYKKGIRLNHGIFKEARDFFEEFFSDSLIQARKALNMKNKLGAMFNGDPGTGKTFLAGQISDELCEKYDAIGFLATQVADYSGLIDAIRLDDKDRNIILIIDEFEKTFKTYDTDTLSFLSGAKERENLIIIATVNDTNQLPSFIKDRPSRFERIFEFNFSNEEVLKSIVTNMIPNEYLDKINIFNLITKIKKHKNMSIDRIKHILRDVIASTIDKDKTGIVKEVIIRNDNNSRLTINGFSQVISDKILEGTELNIDECKSVVEVCLDDPIPTEEIYSLN